MESNEAIIRAGSCGGWNIRVKCQPPNSPDFNVLDLGIFNAIHAEKEKITPYDMVSLVNAVKKAFSRLDAVKIDRCFLTLHQHYAHLWKLRD